MNLLNDEELAAAKYNLKEAKASFACEGIYLSDEENALFEKFEEQRISHDERLKLIIEYSRSRRAAKSIAAE